MVLIKVMGLMVYKGIKVMVECEDRVDGRRETVSLFSAKQPMGVVWGGDVNCKLYTGTA